MMLRYALLLTCVLAFIGCQQRTVYEPDPLNELHRANERIVTQREIKHRLLIADPLERAVEQYLTQHPKTQSAKFAILIPHRWSMNESWLDFATVVTTHEPMSKPDAVRLMLEALASAGLTADLCESDIAMNDLTWSMSWANLRIPLDNSDLSSIPRE